MDESFIRDFLAEFDDSRYPQEFLADYEAMECLAHGEAGETLLVRDRRTGALRVAKCYEGDSLLNQTIESQLLKALSHPGLPAFVGEYRGPDMLCVVREYIEGLPLDEYVAQRGVTQEEAVSICARLCDILAFLHGRARPVIHRDIKPQNVVVDSRGNVRLIDFGISRVYDESARADTVCFGTKRFAAPEQYGFSQTDCRADIFSLGVLLGWLLTGESDAKDALPKIESADLKRIVRRCTSFAPERRYASAARVKARLMRARRVRALPPALALAACAACVLIGFALGRYTDFPPASGVSFKEPLIGQAVRLALGKAEGEPVGTEDLLSVTELYIFGDRAAAGHGEYEALAGLMAQNDGTLKNGGIRFLGDLKGLKNLRRLYVALQDIDDLAPLSSLAALEQIDLKHNPLQDVSPLAALPELKELGLYDTRVSDISMLSACRALEGIDAGNARVASIAAFEGIGSLRRLYVRQTPLETLRGIESFSNLEEIGLSDVLDGDLTPLSGLPRLKEVHLDESLRRRAEKDLRHAKLSIMYP